MAVRTQGGTVLPTGTVTFLFSDIEGSTRLVHSLGDRYGELLEDHHRIMRGAIASSGGTELGTEGDSFFAVFPTAAQAIEATVAAHRALAEHTWPDEAAVLVRMGLHTGDGKLGGDNYIGLDVHRTSRIAAAGHGGQVLVSETTRSLVASALPAGASLRDLGEHRLKDLESPEHLFQLVAAGLRETFPPLRSLDARAVHLPIQMSSFVGRTREKDVLLELLAKENPDRTRRHRQDAAVRGGRKPGSGRVRRWSDLRSAGADLRSRARGANYRGGARTARRTCWRHLRDTRRAPARPLAPAHPGQFRAGHARSPNRRRAGRQGPAREGARVEP